MQLNTVIEFVYPDSKTGEPVVRTGRVEKTYTGPNGDGITIEQANGFRSYSLNKIIGLIKIVG